MTAESSVTGRSRRSWPWVLLAVVACAWAALISTSESYGGSQILAERARVGAIVAAVAALVAVGAAAAGARGFVIIASVAALLAGVGVAISQAVALGYSSDFRDKLDKLDLPDTFMVESTTGSSGSVISPGNQYTVRTWSTSDPQACETLTAAVKDWWTASTVEVGGGTSCRSSATGDGATFVVRLDGPKVIATMRLAPAGD